MLAEDPRADFLPTPGPLHRYREPALPGVRVDSGVVEGGRVHSGFDSMIAKVIASGASRAEACRRLSQALETMVVHGATTNLPFLQALVRHPDFHSASFSTTWIADHLEELNRSLLPTALAERLDGSGFREQLRTALHGRSELTRAAARFEGLDRRFTRVFSERERGAIRVTSAASDGTVTLSGPGLAERSPRSPPPIRASRTRWSGTRSLRSASPSGSEPSRSPRPSMPRASR